MAFCDWLTIYQDHPEGGLPAINNGRVWAIDQNGQIEWTTEKDFEQVGSYDTKIRIKCDGYRVKLSGNVGRFNRTNNVFGHSVSACIQIANRLLQQHGLPPFTESKHNPSAGGFAGGAIITRIDLTENYQTGSHKKAIKLVHFLAGQDAGRRATVKQYGDNGVTWNEGSKYQSSKAYIKAESLGEHCAPHLAEWVRNSGILRHEITLKARYLAQQNLRSIQDWRRKENGKVIDMDNIVYGRFSEVLKRGTACHTYLEDIPKGLGHIALAWRAGKDVWGDAQYASRTKRRWRSQLLPYGIDIKQPSNAVRLATRLEVIEIKAAVPPAWYWDKAA